MNATGSPTWRTAPSASAGCGGLAMSEPSRFCTGAAQGIGRDAVGVQVGRGIDRLNPGDRCCRRRVDRAELRRGVRAAQHDAVQHARQDDIVGVAAAALQQARVLHAADGLGEAELGHGRCLRGSSVAG